MSAPVEPSIKETAFSCPHCGAFTTQYWFKIRASEITGEKPTPLYLKDGLRERIEQSDEFPEDSRTTILEHISKIESGLVFMETMESERCYLSVDNLHLSKCHNCNKIAVWIHKTLRFPAHKTGIKPNSDMPDDIRRDFEEARSIVDESPRGAAALLRLCVQKLCKEFGEKGKRIDDDIAALVKKGLNPLIQQSLDIVRVIGNEAVHPGELDLRDDRETSLRLLEVVNAICEQMISFPKRTAEMYSKLPEDKRKGIENRDKPKA